MWFSNALNTVKGWITSMFGIFSKSKEINEILQTQVSENHYKMLDSWKSIYAGFFEDWHQLKYLTINGTRKRRRHTLNIAKISSSELAKLVFSEKVEINISDKAHAENIENLLESNRFDKMFREKIEQMFAMGGLVLKANPKQQPDGSYKLLIAYVTPDLFIPISWENGNITEGAFMTITRKGEKTYCLFEIHKWETGKGEDGPTKLYSITNVLYEKETRSGLGGQAKQVVLSTLYPELQERATIEGLTKPLFTYIKPNIANNFDLQSPLGISIYGNALDTLYAIDVAFDSFVREFQLGKRRIIVPAQAVRTVIDPQTGEQQRFFDADDEIYQAMNFQDPEKQKIVDNTVELRVEEHLAAINGLLNLYCMQTGFSSGTFTFDGVQVKTATEIISENSKTYQTIKDNENLLEECLESFIYTLTEVGALYGIFEMPNDFDVEFNWDDSIIGDKYTDSDFYIKLINSGLVSKKYSLMKILGLTEEQALEMLKEVSDEQAAQQPDLTDILNDTNPLGNQNNDNADMEDET